MERFIETVPVSTDYVAHPARSELRSNQDGQDNESVASSLPGSVSREKEGVLQTDLDFVNQNQLGSFTEIKSEAETASFKDSQDFLALLSQLNKTLENIKNQEKIIKKGKSNYHPF